MAHDRQVEPMEPTWPHDPAEQGSRDDEQDLPTHVSNPNTALRLRIEDDDDANLVSTR
jgi:hypothetical protein